MAAAWSSLFAALQVFRALGGSIGLAESAGAALARDRPVWFVVCGLYGVAVLLGAAAILGLGRARQRRGRVLPAFGVGVGAVLLVRAAGVETLLVTDAGYGGGAISRAERFWTLVLWNPWLLIGGMTLGLAAIAACRAPPRRP